MLSSTVSFFKMSCGWRSAGIHLVIFGLGCHLIECSRKSSGLSGSLSCRATCNPPAEALQGYLAHQTPPLSPRQDALMLSSTVSFFKTELMELQEDVTQVNAARAEDAQGTSHTSPRMLVYGEKVDISRQNLTFSNAKVDIVHAKSLSFSWQQQTETVFFCFPGKSDIVAVAVSFLPGG